jgi:lipopolysaccharide/colanic/teichoic acid biosynthesis glycosyltransferase
MGRRSGEPRLKSMFVEISVRALIEQSREERKSRVWQRVSDYFLSLVLLLLLTPPLFLFVLLPQ